ncbi:acid-sensing ion channel 1 [Plakobranchus ocellatus]|uniref:Acid-sensing ion channel 1 n=1 Tax=Plakobranchus ocellatus TaxID=259542 RepID=A0AAV4AD47_9GAST|nr:acid-sensing ion channel 1 [Plakobranchus ocellatus]
MSSHSLSWISLRDQLEMFRNQFTWNFALGEEEVNRQVHDKDGQTLPHPYPETDAGRSEHSSDLFRRIQNKSDKHAAQRRCGQANSEKTAVQSDDVTPIEDLETVEKLWIYFGRHTTFHGVKNIESHDRKYATRRIEASLFGTDASNENGRVRFRVAPYLRHTAYAFVICRSQEIRMGLNRIRPYPKHSCLAFFALYKITWEMCAQPTLYLLLVLGMAGGLIYTVADLLVNYYQYRTVTRTDVMVRSTSMFPSVTLCNNCPYRNSADTPDALRRLVSNTSILQGSFPINISEPEIEAILQLSMVEVQENYSYTPDELIFMASYEGEFLNISAAFENIDTSVGRCFTFNGPKHIAMHGPRVATDDGRDSGLRVYMRLFQDEYFIYQDLTAGARMFISNYPDTPRLSKDGIDIHPGTSTRIALNPVKQWLQRYGWEILPLPAHSPDLAPSDIHLFGPLKRHLGGMAFEKEDDLISELRNWFDNLDVDFFRYTFLPAPYSSYGGESCDDRSSDELVHKMVNSTFYSYDLCIEQCVHALCSKKCGCYTPHIYSTNISVCDCPRSCSLTRFDMTISQSSLPSKVAGQYLAHAMNTSNDGEALRYSHLLPSGNILGEDYLELRVYFDTMMVRHEQHEPQFTFNSMFAYLGGQMGFFMGASLITLSELLETLAFTVYVFLHKKLMRIGQMDTKCKESCAQKQPRPRTPFGNKLGFDSNMDLPIKQAW